MKPASKWLDNELKPFCSISGHTNDVTSVDFYGKKLLATGSSDKTIRLYKCTAEDAFQEFPHSPLYGHRYGVNCLTFSPFGTKLASASTDGQTIIWDVKTGATLFSLQASYDSEGVRACCFSPNSALLVTGGDDDKASLYDVSTMTLVGQYDNQESTVNCVAFTPDSLHFVTGGTNEELRLWDSTFGHSLPLAIRQEAHDLGISTLAFNPTLGKEENILMGHQYLLASGGLDNDLHLWLIEVSSYIANNGSTRGPSIKLHHTLCGHQAPIMNVSYLKDGTKLASASGDKTIRIWDAILLIPLAVLTGHGRYATSCSFSEDGRLVASGGGDRRTHIWSLDQIGQKGTNLVKGSQRLRKKFPGIKIRENKKFREWSCDDVCEWLSEHDMAEYSHQFRSHAMTGNELLTVTEAVLQEKLSVEVLGHRCQIMRLISKAKQENNPGSSMLISTSFPEEFFCPITQEVMKDPVIIADGFSYERKGVEAWLSSGKLTSPMTNEKLSHVLIIPNRTLRNLIVKFTDQNVL